MPGLVPYFAITVYYLTITKYKAEKYIYISGGFRGGGFLGFHGTLLSSLARELIKLLLWLTLACFSRKFDQKRIDWTGKTMKMGMVLS